MTLPLPTLPRHDRDPVPDMATAIRDAMASGRSRMEFRFAFGEIPVSGSLAPNGSDHILEVYAPVGIVPYSAEDREARRTIRAAVDELRRHHPDRVGIDGHQTIFIRGSRRIAEPLKAVSVVSALVAQMVDIRPLFDAVGQFLPDLHRALPASRA